MYNIVDIIKYLIHFIIINIYCNSPTTLLVNSYYILGTYYVGIGIQYTVYYIRDTYKYRYRYIQNTV